LELVQDKGGSTKNTMENLEKLIKEMCLLPSETEWVEFKSNDYRADTLGQGISALTNGAALKEKTYGYMLWGINRRFWGGRVPKN
jgi:hypothetical protein